MEDLVIFLVAAICVVVVILLALSYFSKRKASAAVEGAVEQRPRGLPVLRGEGVDGPRRAQRNVRARMRAAAARQEDEEEEIALTDEIAMPEGKVGVKKRRKLEMKAEKRKDREREVEEREERKQRQLDLDEKKRKQDLAEKELERQQEEAEKAIKLEKEQKELEEYLKLKETFDVEEEGYDEEQVEEEGHKFQDFIDYIKNQKVVLLEDLASHFKLKTQDAINRVEDLLAQEWLTGVIDDRGKFVYITKEELESIAQFIKQRGRVSIADLVESSNSLINLNPDTAETVSVS